jgi:hypothetical protein
MTFDADETSVEDSLVRELYELVIAGATYRLTSAEEDVVHGGLIYGAAPVSRGNAIAGDIGSARELVVTIAADHGVVTALLEDGIPPRATQLTITALQVRSGETLRLYRGPIMGITIDGGEPGEPTLARLRVPSALEQTFTMRLPIAVASTTCNHALYDAGCGVARASTHRITATVVSFVGAALTISSVGGKPDAWFAGGEVVHVATEERRTILSASGTTLTLDVPFPSLSSGAALEVWRGCAHDVITCRDEFSNVARFGGHPDLPSTNPTSPTGLGVIVQA